MTIQELKVQSEAAVKNNSILSLKYSDVVFCLRKCGFTALIETKIQGEKGKRCYFLNINGIIYNEPVSNRSDIAVFLAKNLTA